MRGRMFVNTDITRRIRLTYPILIGVCQGEFLDGEVWNVTVFDKNMNSIGIKYVNGNL